VGERNPNTTDQLQMSSLIQFIYHTHKVKISQWEAQTTNEESRSKEEMFLDTINCFPNVQGVSKKRKIQ